MATNRNTPNADTQRRSGGGTTDAQRRSSGSTEAQRRSAANPETQRRSTGSGAARGNQSQSAGQAGGTAPGRAQETTDQVASTTPSRAGAATTGTQTQPDRERPVQASRESGGGRQVARREGNVSPVYGGGFGTGSNPFIVMRRMMDDMDRLFSNFGVGGSVLPSSIFGQDYWGSGGGGGLGSQSPAMQTLWSPQVDVFNRGNELVVRADLPGLDKDNVNIEIADGVLTIRGERQDEFEDNREGIYRSERSYGSFYRAIPLPEGVSGDNAEATFKDGVLEVTMPAPKTEQAAKKIQIK